MDENDNSETKRLNHIAIRQDEQLIVDTLSEGIIYDPHCKFLPTATDTVRDAWRKLAK